MFRRDIGTQMIAKLDIHHTGRARSMWWFMIRDSCSCYLHWNVKATCQVLACVTYVILHLVWLPVCLAGLSCAGLRTLVIWTCLIITVLSFQHMSSLVYICKSWQLTDILSHLSMTLPELKGLLNKLIPSKDHITRTDWFTHQCQYIFQKKMLQHYTWSIKY